MELAPRRQIHGSRTGQLEAELLAAQDDVARLKASPLVDQAIEPSWQQGTTQLGTPGADHRDDLASGHVAAAGAELGHELCDRVGCDALQNGGCCVRARGA